MDKHTETSIKTTTTWEFNEADIETALRVHFNLPDKAHIEFDGSRALSGHASLTEITEGEPK